MEILSNVHFGNNQAKEVGEAFDPSDAVNLLKVNTLWDARYTDFHQLQKCEFSSGWLFDPNTFQMSPPSPPSFQIQNKVSVVTINDTNTANKTALDMSLTLPISPVLWNISIRVIVLDWTTIQGSAIQTLTFAPPQYHTILNTHVFNNVAANSVFELQFLSAFNQWFIIKIN